MLIVTGETRGRVLDRAGSIQRRLTRMSYETLERLERLRTLNSNKQWVNHDVYRLLYKEDLYILAYERIKSKPGNMTPGTDEETLDGFSLEAIREMISEMKTEQFCFKPVRQQFIPKPNGKMRKLGIPCVRDKIVQEVIRLILEAIYDSPHGPHFRDTSHGFRPHRSCHTALREFREKWTAVNWLIEGDIRACFDELSHQTLVSLLHKKIHDQRFLNLIWKLLNAGYMDLHGVKKDSLIGSPQGGIASPILANVYLHELDEFMDGLRRDLEKGQEKHRDPVYRRLSKKKARLAARGNTRTKEFKELTKRMRATPSRQVSDPNYIRIRYLRYADDWLVGVGGSHALAEEIKQKIKAFLSDHLHLTLSEEKTHITNARTEEAFFLGTTLKIGNGGNAKLKQMTNWTGKTFKRRTTGWETVMSAPLPKLVKRLHERGFCSKEGEPTPKSGWAFLDVDQIVNLYSGVNRGIQNYYRFTDNWGQLHRVQYILEYSLAKTLALKFNISVPKVFKRFGRGFPILIEGKTGKADRMVSFYLNQDWTKKRDAFQNGTRTDIDLVRTAIRMRTRSKLGKPCCICADVGQIVMHHVRHVRKLTNKRVATGFNLILRAINRKQIPVCTACHGKIHRGEYDGLLLTDLEYIPR
jgi:group II intron reverse transcriptase/maturase